MTWSMGSATGSVFGIPGDKHLQLDVLDLDTLRITLTWTTLMSPKW